MIEFLLSTVAAFAFSLPITIGLGFVYYSIAVAMMNVCRRVWGEGHKGYYLLNLAVILLFVTFLLLFSFFARSF